MDEADRDIRNRTYALFAELGRAPVAAEVGRGTEEAWPRLHEQHALVLDERGELLMANPFSAIPTPYEIDTPDGRTWYGNCAWDAIGVLAALHADGRVRSTCPDCGDPIHFEIRNEQPDVKDTFFHCLVPAAHWWDDIGFT